MNLSPHFTLAELLRSEVAARRGIEMVPPPDVVDNLRQLVTEVLEPLRAAIRAPLYITSGYRPYEVNRLVGGAPSSDHLHGLAADFVVPSMEHEAVVRIVMDTVRTLPVAKAIDEFGRWVHVSLGHSESVARRLTARHAASGVQYREWRAPR